jgi:hypothetical protein
MRITGPRVLMTFIFPTLMVARPQTPISHGKPTEKVVIQYERLVAKGEFLTPEGWRVAGKLYEQADAFPPDGEISLMDTGGAVGENWLRGDTAEVETKWTDYFGTIDSALRYRALHFPVPVTMTPYVFRLTYTNKHRDIGKNGETIREVDGPWEWKIEGPRTARWTTVDRALEYVVMRREKIDNPITTRNADMMIAALKKLGKPCGNASTC